MFDRYSKAALLSAVLLAVALPGLAQDEAPELITDRPDQTESAAIVPRGSVQLELGATFSHSDGDGLDVDLLEVPGTLARIGLSERWELRLGWTGYTSVDVGAFDESGIGDAEIGFKYRIRDEGDKGAPEVAVLFGSSVPVGDDAFTSDRADPSFRLIFAHTLSERLSVGYNLGMALASGRDETGEVTTLSTYVYTLALGISLADNVGAFVELFGEAPGSAPGGPANSFDGGFTFLLRDNVQFDVAAGAGLSEAADDYFFGVGLTVRWPR